MQENSDQDYLLAIIDVCREMFATSDIAADDNFFMLGGTSLNVIELTEKLLGRYQVDLPLDAVFACETLAELAHHCQRAAGSSDLPQDVARQAT
jgi:acyl carrier protein